MVIIIGNLAPIQVTPTFVFYGIHKAVPLSQNRKYMY